MELDNINIAKALNIRFEIPEGYEFERQVIKGTKDRMSEKDDLGYVHERYAQYYKGIKIEHSDVRVHYLDNSFVSANGEYIDAPNIDVSVILSKEEAIQKAKEYIGAKEYMWENEAENDWLKNTANDKSASFYPDPELVICKNSIDNQDTLFYIAYKIDIYAKYPVSRDYVYVDAKTGGILAINAIIKNVNGTAATRYSGTRTISTQQNGSVYRLRGYDNNRSVETYNMNKGTNYNAATDFTDANNNWTAAEFHNTNKDDGALDAHWGTMMTYDYFKNIHNRNSYDNNGGVLRNYVHANLIALGYQDNDNAFWDGSRMTYGDGTNCDILTELDIIAHEIGHGVCEYTADLVYQGESGAINESLSDIWGACVKNYTNSGKPLWTLGDDIGCVVRSMSNPKSKNNPDTYGGVYWVNPSSSYDNGGVHINSGIMNYWFYLLSVGGSGTNDNNNNYNVSGISIPKSEKIAYRAETVYMTVNTNFANARAHAIQAAIDLYGNCSPEVISTTNAWYAVGVGNEFTSTVSFTNQTVSSNTTVVGCDDLTVQNVTVTNNAQLKLEAPGEVTINGLFEVQSGSVLEIK
jgi:Zn-dependent metalloprotease